MKKESKRSKQQQKPKRKPNRKPTKTTRKANAGSGFTLDKAAHGIVDLVGRHAHKFIAQIAGRGEYKVNKNTLWTGQVPSFRNNQVGTDIIHREFVRDISGSTTFQTSTFNINPGLENTFPWLSSIAGSFEEYELMGMVYEFKSTCGTAVGSTNTALGTVIMATDYDVLDLGFTSKTQMEAYEYSTSCVPSANMYHPVECDPRQNVMARRYIRVDENEADSDKRFHDHGFMQIATVGMQAVNVVGELWVSYHVRFYKPKLRTALQFPVGFAHYIESPAATATSTSTFGAIGPIQIANTIGVSLNYTPTNAPVNVILPVVGYYLLLVATTESATAVNGSFAIPTTSVNILSYNILFNNTNSGFGVGNASTSLLLKLVQVVNPLNSPDVTNTLVYTPRTGTYTNGRTDLLVISMPETFAVSLGKMGLSTRMDLIESMLQRLMPSDNHDDDVVSVSSCASNQSSSRYLKFR